MEQNNAKIKRSKVLKYLKIKKLKISTKHKRTKLRKQLKEQKPKKIKKLNINEWLINLTTLDFDSKEMYHIKSRTHKNKDYV